MKDCPVNTDSLPYSPDMKQSLSVMLDRQNSVPKPKIHGIF